MKQTKISRYILYELKNHVSMSCTIIILDKTHVVNNNYSRICLRSLELNNYGEFMFNNIKSERNKIEWNWMRRERNDNDGEEKK